MSSKSINLIICENFRFRADVRQLLNSLGITEENVCVPDLEKARSNVGTGFKTNLVIIDGVTYDQKLEEIIAGVYEAPIYQLDMDTIAFITSEQREKLKIKSNDYPNLHFLDYPMMRQKIIGVLGENYKVTKKARASARQQKIEKEKQSNAISVLEATKHLLICINQIQDLNRDRQNIQAILEIGQRFNGVAGTFSFFSSKVGFKEISEMSFIIDTISKHYARSSDVKQIKDEHFDLFTRSMKCSFMMLKDMREDKPIQAASMVEFNDIMSIWDKTDDVEKPKTHSQTEADQILSDLQKAQ